MTLEVQAKQKPLGTIAETGSVKKGEAAFDTTLGLIFEPDVSGVSEADLGKVAAITIFKVITNDEDEFIVFQLFDSKQKQIGGTFLGSGMGTSCLPN